MTIILLLAIQIRLFYEHSAIFWNPKFKHSFKKWKKSNTKKFFIKCRFIHFKLKVFSSSCNHSYAVTQIIQLREKKSFHKKLNLNL